MIKPVLQKIIRFFFRLLSKIIYFLVPIISRIFITLRLNSRIINQFNKLRHESHKIDDHTSFISKLLDDNKLVALDVGAQGGFFNNSIFCKKYDNFFTPIVVEPLANESKKLTRQGYKVISKGLWSINCKKKLYILGKRSGSSSMYRPSKDNYDLYNFKKKDFSLFDVTREIDVECTTVNESLNKLNINNLESISYPFLLGILLHVVLFLSIHKSYNLFCISDLLIRPSSEHFHTLAQSALQFSSSVVDIRLNLLKFPAQIPEYQFSKNPNFLYLICLNYHSLLYTQHRFPL